MTIGEQDNIRIYLVRSKYPKPTPNVFIDYTSFFISYEVKGKIRTLAKFEGVCAGINDEDSPESVAGVKRGGTRRDDIKEGNYLYVMSSLKLISKFEIVKTNFKSDGLCEITALESSGSESNPGSSIKKNLRRTNMGKFKLSNKTLTYIFTNTVDGTEGIFIDANGNKVIEYDKDNNLDIDSEEYSISFDYPNRVKAMSDICDTARKEWTIYHGSNGTEPFIEGDSCYILERVGNSHPTYSFSLSGNNMNCKPSSALKDSLNSFNHIIVQGVDVNGKQMEVEVHDSVVNYDSISETIDGWTSSKISASDMVIPVSENNGFNNLTNFYVKIDSELIFCSEYDSSKKELVVGNNGRGTGYGVFTQTQPLGHKKGSDVVLVDDGDGMGFIKPPGSPPSIFLPLTFAVSCSNGDKLAIGSEIVEVVSGANASTLRVSRMGSAVVPFVNESWDDAYAHSKGTKVYNHSLHNLDDPEQGSSVYEGLVTKVVTSNTSINKDQLDKKGEYLLKNRKKKIDNISLNPINPYEFFSNVGLGDAVNVIDCDSLNIGEGEYRFVEYKFKFPNKLTIYLNNKDSRGYVVGATNFTETLEESSKPKRQSPIRSMSHPIQEGSNEAGEYGFDSGPKRVSNVIVPKESWGNIDVRKYLKTDADSSAANVGFVKAHVYESMSVNSYWEDGSSSTLTPITAGKSLVQKNSGSLGTQDSYWDDLFTVAGHINDLQSQNIFVNGNQDSCTASFRNVNGGNSADSLRAGWLNKDVHPDVDPEGWNLRVGGSVVSVFNGPLRFHYKNPGGDKSEHLRFDKDNVGNFVGFRIGPASKLIEYSDNSGNDWHILSSVQTWENIYPGKIRTVEERNIIPNGDSSIGTKSDVWGVAWIDKFGKSILPRVPGLDLGKANSSYTWTNLYLYSKVVFPYSYIEGGTSDKRLSFYVNGSLMGYFDPNKGFTAGRFRITNVSKDETFFIDDINPFVEIHAPLDELKFFDSKNTSGVTLSDLKKSNGSYWEISSYGELKPTENRDLIPHTNKKNRLGNSNNIWYSVYTYGLSVQGYSNFHGQQLSGLGTLKFNNDSLNTIYDSEDDLFVRGKDGLYLDLYNSGGGVIVRNASTLRPGSNGDILLGSSSWYWKGLYTKSITLNGVTRTSWPSGSSGGWEFLKLGPYTIDDDEILEMMLSDDYNYMVTLNMVYDDRYEGREDNLSCMLITRNIGGHDHVSVRIGNETSRDNFKYYINLIYKDK